MNKIKIINLPEITEADSTTYIPVSSGSTNATRKISAANLIGVTSPIQAQLDSKASAENATFTGITNFEGNVQVSEDIIVDGDARSYSSTVDTRLKFGSGAVVKIQTGVVGGRPVYREFPATELSSSDLNGSNYVMVYGTGTPEENAAELQAAYNEAKNMPRYIGSIRLGDASKTYYKGQTYYQVEYTQYRRMLSTVTSFGNGDVVNNKYSKVISESEAKATRTTVIVAPGQYTSGSVISFDKRSINISSLTGNRDVRIQTGCNVSAGYVTISGIDTATSTFTVADNLQSLVLINCGGGNYSFGANGNTVGTFIDCIGGAPSFGGGGTFTGSCIRCTGQPGSFGSLSSGSILRDCTLFNGSYSDYSAGKVINCIDGDGNIINNPPLAASSDSKVKLITLDDPQDSNDEPDTYSLTMEDNGATLIVNDGGLTSTGLVIFDFSKFTLGELSQPFAVTIVGVGYVYAAYKLAGEPVVQLTSGESFGKTIMLCRDPRAGLDTPFARILG